MESLIDQIDEEYQKDLQKQRKESQEQKTDKIYILHSNLLSNNIPNKKVKNEQKYSFSTSLCEGLNEDEMFNFIKNTKIPSNYINKIIKKIFKAIVNTSSSKKKGKKQENIDFSLLMQFLETNKEKFTEKNIILIFEKIKEYNVNDDIISFIIANINVDEKYFLSIIKKENIEFDKNLLKKLNNIISENNFESPYLSNWVNLIKTLNLIYYVKLIITKEEYEEFEEKINEKQSQFLDKMQSEMKNDAQNEEGENKDDEFIKSLKMINSNLNKSYYIEEKIII